MGLINMVAVIVLCMQVLRISATMNEWMNRGNAQIRDCHSHREIWKQRLYNGTSARMMASNSIVGQRWTMFSNVDIPSLHMFGIHRNGSQWFFMQPVQNRIRLIKNYVPTNANLNDPRIFQYYFRGLDRDNVIKHVPTETYLFFNQTVRLATTSNSDFASHFCITLLNIKEMLEAK